jgi:hypothetical protein
MLGHVYRTVALPSGHGHARRKIDALNTGDIEMAHVVHVLPTGTTGLIKGMNDRDDALALAAMAGDIARTQVRIGGSEAHPVAAIDQLQALHVSAARRGDVIPKFHVDVAPSVAEGATVEQLTRIIGETLGRLTDRIAARERHYPWLLRFPMPAPGNQSGERFHPAATADALERILGYLPPDMHPHIVLSEGALNARQVLQAYQKFAYPKHQDIGLSTPVNALRTVRERLTSPEHAWRRIARKDPDQVVMKPTEEIVHGALYAHAADPRVAQLGKYQFDRDVDPPGFVDAQRGQSDPFSRRSPQDVMDEVRAKELIAIVERHPEIFRLERTDHGLDIVTIEKK